MVLSSNITYRLHALLFPFLLSGCVPLPDKAPSLQEVQLPHRGDSMAEVRHVFGDPQVLDSGRYLIYDWNGSCFGAGTVFRRSRYSRSAIPNDDHTG